MPPIARCALFCLGVLLAGCQATPRAAVSAATPAAPVVTPPPPRAEPKEISFRSLGFRTPVIMYHDVVPRRTRDTEWFDVSVDELREQLDWMVREGITPVSLADLQRHLTHGEPLPYRSIVLTFDDNYQGFYDNAWPLLKQYNMPVAMFVHTGFVGDTKRGRPKMSWETLSELSKDPLMTIGAHTVTHPDDLTKLPAEKQLAEMRDSKTALEEKLGIKVDTLAYPNGPNDKTSQEMARKAGFTMAFSVDNGLAEESPTIMSVNRYVHTRLKTAWEDRERAITGAPANVFVADIKEAPVSEEASTIGRVKLLLVKGGKPESLTSATRQGVLDFVKRADAVAGINGAFFVMSDIKGTDNKMLGTFKSSDIPLLLPDRDVSRWPKIRNRPIVMWDDRRVAILPYQPAIMSDERGFQEFMPDMTDTFLGGVWLVHNGIAQTREQMNAFASKDIQDPRRRAFFGVMLDGTIVLGASKNSVTSVQLAEAAAAAGVGEAVLLDSGFSTSLVFDGEILASGHSTEKIPSRPVPHAIVVRGVKALDPKFIGPPAPPRNG